MPTDRPQLGIAAVARLFVLLALTFPVLWSQDQPALLALLAVGLVWLLVTLAEWRWPDDPGAAPVVEGIAVGVLVGLSMHSSLGVLGALVVPPFTAGVYGGLWGVARALSAEVIGVAVALLVSGHGLNPNQGYAAFSWSCTGLGLGMVAAFLHSALRERNDPLAPYHYAQILLRQLISISDGLDSGINPVSLGGAILSEVCDELPTSSQALYVPRGETLIPLVTRSISGADLGAYEDAAVEAWTRSRPVLVDRIFAFPLVTESGTAAVVVAALSERVDTRHLEVENRVRKLVVRLRPSAVHLDTALLFAAFRDSATTEERRRLAREMHDGVAQDIASLGYLVDALHARAVDEQQAERIAFLRDRITAIVAEVRRSVVNLRTSVGASESLGAALGSIARNLSEVSGVPIHVTLDETTDRLRPDVEGELFRIAQEAMNNAVKHAQASAIEVTCQVRAPAATITISDNGRGLQAPRKGSHGLSIMRERAHLVGADLAIDQTPGGGLTVSVTITEQRMETTDSGAVRSEARVGA